MTTSFRAYAKGHASTYAPTAREAAQLFFTANPRARKCDVIEGTHDGRFFTVSYGRVSDGGWPKSFKGVTRNNLPNTEVTI